MSSTDATAGSGAGGAGAGASGVASGAVKVWIHNAAQVVAVTGGNDGRVGTAAMNDVQVLAGGSVLVGGDGRIVMVGPADVVQAAVDAGTWTCDEEAKVDATGKTVLPGFVDCHTHAVFSGDRSHEMAMKLAGKTYVDIYKAGGGIQFTVRSTRESSQEELEALLEERLTRMLKCGTTTAEIKSGYGLDVESEMKMLRVIHNVNKRHPVDCVATFCGAHAVPPDRTPATQTDDVIDNQLPALKKLHAEGKVSPTFIDVFCEKGFFDQEQTARILKAGAECGLLGNFHGDELNPMQSGALAASTGSRAVSHLEHLDDADITAMAAGHVFGVLLPTTAYLLRLAPPPARKLIDNGVPVALGSDFNPNAWCLSMPAVMNLACVTLRMTMNEALVAATINSAAALNIGDSVGSIEQGKVGDIVVFDVPQWEHVIYQMGDGAPVSRVFKAGECVFNASTK